MHNAELNSAIRKGKIKFVNHKAKFGFIIDQDSKEEFYFKTSDLKVNSADLLNLEFNFETINRKRGLEAINIVISS